MNNKYKGRESPLVAPPFHRQRESPGIDICIRRTPVTVPTPLYGTRKSLSYVVTASTD